MPKRKMKYRLAPWNKCRGWTGFLMNLGFRPAKADYTVPYGNLIVQPMSLPTGLIFLPRTKW